LHLTNASNLTAQAVAFFAKKPQKTAPTHSAVYAGVMLIKKEFRMLFMRALAVTLSLLFILILVLMIVKQNYDYVLFIGLFSASLIFMHFGITGRDVLDGYVKKLFALVEEKDL
jgi:hypothetical protein